MCRLLAFLVISLLFSPSLFAARSGGDLYTSLSRQAPALDKKVLKKALDAMECATLGGVAVPENLGIIDYQLPSNQNRLWIFNLSERRLIFKDLVAHGKNSGHVSATSFSNTNGSLQSSLGLFLGKETYYGKHGYSLRLDGLEPGINDKARERAIVIHGAGYVDPVWIKNHGRIGRSFGCPAVRREIARDVVDSLKGGQLIFSYYPDADWLESSNFLNCQGQKLASKSHTLRSRKAKTQRQGYHFRKS